MKLTSRDIGAFLSQPHRYRAILLYGSDEGLIRERRKAVLQKTGDPTDPFGVLELSAEQIEKEPQKLHEALASYSLMGGAPVVWVRGVNAKVSAIILEALAGEKGNFLVVSAGELESRQSLRKTFEDRPDLAALACYADEGDTLDKVIRGFFNKHAIQCSPEVLSYLKQHLGNDRAITLSELEKIALYLGDDKELTAEMAQALVNENGLLALEDLTYALTDGNMREIHHHCERLLLEEMHPVAMLRGMIRMVERLLLAKSYMAQGKNADGAMMALRPPVFFKEKDRMKRSLARRSVAELESLLTRLVMAERSCKRGGDTELVFVHAITEAARF